MFNWKKTPNPLTADADDDEKDAMLQAPANDEAATKPVPDLDDVLPHATDDGKRALASAGAKKSAPAWLNAQANKDGAPAPQEAPLDVGSDLSAGTSLFDDEGDLPTPGVEAPPVEAPPVSDEVPQELPQALEAAQYFDQVNEEVYTEAEAAPTPVMEPHEPEGEPAEAPLLDQPEEPEPAEAAPPEDFLLGAEPAEEPQPEPQEQGLFDADDDGEDEVHQVTADTGSFAVDVEEIRARFRETHEGLHARIEDELRALESTFHEALDDMAHRMAGLESELAGWERRAVASERESVKLRGALRGFLSHAQALADAEAIDLESDEQ